MATQPVATDAGVGATVASPPPPATPARPPRRRRRHVLWAALAVLVVASGVVAVLGLAPPATTLEAQSPLIGQPAPAITGPTISGGAFSLSDLRGHFVVIDFFSSWCVACRQEQPQLERFVAEHDRPGGARLVGVIFEDTVPAIRGFLGPELGRYPVVTDPGGRTALDYGVDNPPEKYLVDPSGVIFAKVIGPVTAAGLDQLIAKAQAAGA